MRYSHQRERIYRAVVESHEHPTANMVYEQLKAEMPKLSLGTVYRNLNQLADAGRLKKIPLADGSCRFDKTTTRIRISSANSAAVWRMWNCLRLKRLKRRFPRNRIYTSLVRRGSPRPMQNLRTSRSRKNFERNTASF
jgi:DNA-binding HxlR family transcriptional regulator